LPVAQQAGVRRFRRVSEPCCSSIADHVTELAVGLTERVPPRIYVGLVFERGEIGGRIAELLKRLNGVPRPPPHAPSIAAGPPLGSGRKAFTFGSCVIPVPQHNQTQPAPDNTRMFSSKSSFLIENGPTN
jgi:hypothetical protein